MDLQTAFEIVTTIVSENIISEEEASQDPDILQPEREKQLEALNKISGFLNKSFNNNLL